MLPGRSYGVHGTPVPKRDVELKSRGSGPVITYKLSPEELKQYLQHLASPENKKTPFVFPKPKSDQEKEEAAVAELTREEYLRLRLEGKGRAAIQREHFRNNSTKFYRTLKEWGIREMEDEERELEQLKTEQTQPAKSDPYKETAEKMISQDLQQDLQKDAIVERLNQLLAEKTARIRELEETVNRLEAERAVLLSTIEKAVDDSAPGQADHDPVSHPAHYTAGKVECIDAIESATVGLTGGAAYCTGNAIKYLWRWSRKGGVEDLQKARWYIDRLIETATNKS